jgi:quinol monooxygenase YgiN
MSYVICATWKAKPGEEATIIDLLDQVSRASVQEPGCLLFWVHRSIDDPSTFLLYEQYASEAAFKAHAASDHVRRFVLEDAVHRLESRKREPFDMVVQATKT